MHLACGLTPDLLQLMPREDVNECITAVCRCNYFLTCINKPNRLFIYVVHIRLDQRYSRLNKKKIDFKYYQTLH